MIVFPGNIRYVQGGEDRVAESIVAGSDVGLSDVVGPGGREGCVDEGRSGLGAVLAAEVAIVAGEDCELGGYQGEEGWVAGEGLRKG